MAIMRHYPVLRVVREGTNVKRIEWDPLVDGSPIYDLSGLHVLNVESVAKMDGSLPQVKITLAARLVDAEPE